MKKLILAIAAIPSIIACSHDVGNKPTAEQSNRIVKYNCARGDTLSVSFSNSSSQNKPENKIAIVNGFSKKPIILKSQASNIGFLYSNGKFTLRGNGKHATWTVGRMAPINCWLGDTQVTNK